MTDPDVSGMLRFLTDELQDAEDAGDRVWITGHVLSGWDGSNPLMNPTNLFYQIVDRFSPHVIAAIFWGHTHQDELSVFYANNGTVVSSETARAVAWIGPSLTPLTGLNSGFRVYEVDSDTFEILDSHTWASDVSTYPELDPQTERGPVYFYEYSAREAYGKTIAGWGPNDPLNATWWHLVTEGSLFPIYSAKDGPTHCVSLLTAMEKDPSLVQKFAQFQGKSNIRSPNCTTSDCVAAKICYMRNGGSASLAKQRCPPGFGSAQGST
ncbi:hypothetical protein PM082_003373 [Marasmius tenuissimus]|nr:hypothetical protein PM082_003373 [Marasmius tenuissimus]